MVPRFRLSLLALALAWASPGIADADTDFPKNLLRTHCGARWVQGPAPSLNDDPSSAFRVARGQVRWVADLGQHHVVDKVTFQHTGLSGRLSIEATPSLHLPSWQSLGSVDLRERDPIASASLIPTVGRYLRFSVDTKSEGSVMALGVFGPLRVSELQLVPASAWAENGKHYHSPEAFSLLNGLSLSSVVSVSSGEGSAIHLRDEDVSTSYLFSGRRSPAIELDLGMALRLKGLVVLQSDTGGSWSVRSDQEYRGMVSQGIARVDLMGKLARTLELRWSGRGDPPRVYEIAVFPVRGLVKPSGYGKNASTGKNASLGKQSLALRDDFGHSPDGEGFGGAGFSPYFGVRGAGGLPGTNGFPTRVAGGGADDGDGGPVITPGSF